MITIFHRLHSLQVKLLISLSNKFLLQKILLKKLLKNRYLENLGKKLLLFAKKCYMSLLSLLDGLNHFLQKNNLSSCPSETDCVLVSLIISYFHIVFARVCTYYLVH